MTKSEKNAIADVIAILNAIVNNNDEDGKNNHQAASNEHQPASSQEENPSKEEIAFVRKMANERPFSIIGYGVKPEEGVACDIKISKDCLDHMVTAYLEKYCHE